MAVEIIDFPSALKISDRSDPMLIQNTRSGGVGMDGGEQIMSPLSGRWEWRVAIPIRNEMQARQLRVLKSRMKGRFNYVRMSLCDQYRITLKDVGGDYPEPGIPHDDDTLFSDDSGYQNSVTSPVQANAAANATVISIRASDLNGKMAEGVYFSINEWLYLVESFELDGTDYLVTFSPPLREAVVIGEEANFSGVALWSFVSDATGDIDMRIGRFGTAALNFVEPVGRRLDVT
jgi:hypothetical protein